MDTPTPEAAPPPTTETKTSTSADAPAAAAAAAPWYEGVKDEKLRASLSRYGTIDDFAKGYSHMEKRAGAPAERQILLPADPNDKDGTRAVLGKLGLPEKADGYALSLGDKATDADKAMLGRFAERMHQAGALPAAAQEAVKFLQEEQASALEKATQARQELHDKAEAELKTEWGAAYPQNVKAVGQLCAKYGDPELAAELAETKMGDNPRLVRMLAKIAEGTMEPAAPAGSNRDAAGGDRPLTPAAAKAKAAELEAHVAFRDKMHPQHVFTVKERSRMLAMAEGRSA